MTHATRRFRAPTLDAAEFAARLQVQLELYWNLILALADLRQDGPPAQVAVDALLDLPTMRLLRSSWELWDVLVIGDGHEPDALLAQHMRLDHLDLVRFAIWGDTFGLGDAA